MAVTAFGVQARGRLISGCCSLVCLLGVLHYAFPAACAGSSAPEIAWTETAAARTALTLPKRKSEAPAPSPNTGNPLWRIALSLLSATRERPLFSPTRRPPARIVAAPPPPTSPPKPVPPPQPALNIVGTAIGNDQRLGIFVDQTTKEVVRLRVGQGYEGWTLQAIDGREAILEQDQHTVTLGLPSEGRIKRPATVSPLTRPVQQAGGESRVAPPGEWLDGDGQVIATPPSPASYGQATPPVWVDGDGQRISPPSH
jgi:general secretion pathway protein N